jgi:hypothetical protein
VSARTDETVSKPDQNIGTRHVDCLSQLQSALGRSKL